MLLYSLQKNWLARSIELARAQAAQPIYNHTIRNYHQSKLNASCLAPKQIRSIVYSRLRNDGHHVVNNRQDPTRNLRHFLHDNAYSTSKPINPPVPTEKVTKPDSPPNSISPSPSTLSPPNQPHNSLASFLQYATRTSLSPKSTVFHGTRYEYLVQQHLTTNLGFKLDRVGGRNDSGIDLIGHWDLPSILEKEKQKQKPHHQTINSNEMNLKAEKSYKNVPQIPILIQCKRLTRPTPTLIRELEGSFLALPHSFRRPSPSSPPPPPLQQQHASHSSSSPSATSESEKEQDILYQPQTLGILVCSRPATKGIREAMARSRRGLAWVTLEEETNVNGLSSTAIVTSQDGAGRDLLSPRANIGEVIESDGDQGDVSTGKGVYDVPATRIRQFLWNRAASELCGLEGLDVGLRRGNHDTNGPESEVMLLWQGSPITF